MAISWVEAIQGQSPQPKKSQFMKCLAYNGGRPLDVSRRMRRRNKASLKLRRREVDAAFQAGMEKFREHFQVASLGSGKIDNWS